MKIIDECDTDLSQYGFSQKKHQFGICENFLKVSTEKHQKKLGWKQGEYYIVNCPDLYLFNKKILDYLEGVLKNILKKLTNNFLNINKLLHGQDLDLKITTALRYGRILGVKLITLPEDEPSMPHVTICYFKATTPISNIGKNHYNYTSNSLRSITTNC